MQLINSEKRTQVSLFSFIDLLFLLVAFLVLVIFFMQIRKSAAEVELEKVQQKLSVVEEKKSAIEDTLTRFAPVIEQFTIQKKKEIEKRQAMAAREIRKRRRTTVKLNYNVDAVGKIIYGGKSYTLERFKSEVVEKLRKEHWIAFRAYAEPETPFGTVVNFRAALLSGSGEFDTYWDNLTSNK